MALTRRSFARLTGVAAGATVLSFGGVLASCSNGAAGSNASAGAASGASRSAEQPSQVVISMPPGSEPAAGFDPFVSWGCGEHVHEPLIQSTLITTDTDLNFVNDLAVSYECAPDGMKWTFVLRDDAFFTDGEPLTANDVAFTINGIKESAAAEADLSTIESAEALDGTTVVLHMERPNNALLYTLAVVGIVPAHAHGADYGTNPVGSGRYMLEQWDKGQQVILRANSNYYGSAPKIERVVVLFMEEDASLAAACAGQVDVAYTSALYADGLPSGYALLDCKSVDSRGISLPCLPSGSPEKRADGDASYKVGNDATSDLSLRRAMNYAVDRQRMIDNVLNGYGTCAFSVGDGMPWSSDDMKVECDVEQAKHILSEGGWQAGADGILEKDGVRASFDLYYAAGDSVRQALAYDFADQMASLGINVEVKGASWDDIYPNEFSSPILWGWGSNSPVEMYELTHSVGWGNYACYENSQVDANLDAALAQADINDSYDYYKKAQWDAETGEGVAPQGASTWIWLANVDHLYFQRDGLVVAQQKPHPHGHGWSLVNNVDQWEWE